jgi:translocation and assembly module TamB
MAMGDADRASTAPAPRRGRWLVGALAVLLGALLIGAALASWLIGASRGTAWLLARASQVSVTQPTGRLFGGAFAAERIELRAGARPITLHRLAWRDARWAWRPHDGAWVGLVIDGVRVERVEVGAAAATSAAAAPTTLRLPLVLTLSDLRIGTLLIEAAAPLHDIAARVELGHDQGRAHRVPTLAARSERARFEGSLRIDSDAPFALDAKLRAASLDGAARAWQASAAASGPLASLAVEARLTSPQAAGAQVDARATIAPFAAWPLSALQASTRGLDLSALIAGAPRTLLSGQARIDTRGLDQPISASVKLANAEPGRWDQQRLPLAEIDVDATGRADQRDRLTLNRFELRAPGDGGRASGQGQWQGGTATIDLTLHALKPAALDARAPALTLSGTLGSRWLGLPSPDGTPATSSVLQVQSQLALDGRVDAKRGEALRLAAALQAQRSAEGWRIELRDAQARSGSARLEGALTLDRRAGGAATLDTQGQARGFDPAPWWPAAPSARLNGRWQAQLQAPLSWRFVIDSAASWLALRGKAQLDLHDSVVAGVPLQAALRADTAAGGGWNADATLQAANNRARIAGVLAMRADADRWRAETAAPALVALRPLLTALGARAAPLAAVEGAANAEIQLEGRWPALRSRGTLRADNLRLAAFGAARLNAQWQAGADRDAPLALDIDGQRIAWDATTLATARGKIDGTLATHRIELDATSALRPPAWTDAILGAAQPARGSALELRGQARWQSGAAAPAGVWRATLSKLDARANDAADAADATGAAGASSTATQPWLVARELQLHVALDAAGRISEVVAEPGSARVLGAPLVWREARWLAAAPERPAVAVLDAELQPMTVAPWLARWQPGAGFGGDLAVKGSIVLRHGRNFAADVVLERAAGDLTVTNEGVTQSLGLTDLRLSMVANEGTWHFAQALAGANAGVLAGALSMRTSPTATWPGPETPLQGVLEWGVADLGVWAPFTPPGWRVAGRLHTSAAIGGRFGAPEIEGRMEGSQLAIRNLLQGVDVREGELALSLRGADARIERFVFKGGDGTLRVTGGAVLGAEPKATLQLAAERFLALGRTDRRVVASGAATLALDAQALALNGQFTIDEGLLDLASGDAPTLDSDISVRGGKQALAKAVKAAKAAEAAEVQRQAAAVPARANTRALRDTRVAVQLDLGQRLRLRGRGLDTRLEGRVAITAPNGRLALDGQVRAADGLYAAYGQKLEIERGVVSFSGNVENPRLDIRAVRPNLDVEVGVQIEGSAQSPRVRLVSTPEMADYDKLSWLVLGRAPDGLGRNDTALLQGAALALLAGEGQSLNAQLLSSIGLDEFSLRQAESGEVRETVVTLGKQLSRRWFVGYERSVNDTTGTWQLVYRAAQRFTLRAQSGEDNSLDAIWTWRWN